jgi:hypothetical protein
MNSQRGITYRRSNPVGYQHHSMGRDQWCVTRTALPMRALNKDTIGIDHDGRHPVWGWEQGVLGECTGAKTEDPCIGTNEPTGCG